MSHAATKWAIEQRGLRPAAKIVLWHLCDRYHPDNGCFPSQDRLADDCEMSRSALNDHLKSLEEACKIKRDQRRDPRTRKIISTQYHFPFEDGFVATPCPEIGQGTVSENMPEPSPENADSRVRNPDTNLVIEPVREPYEREALKRESEDHIPDRPWLDELIQLHPQGSHARMADLAGPWKRFDREKRKRARDHFPIWVSEKGGRTKLSGLDTYLNDEMFERVKSAPLAATQDGDVSKAPAFDQVWFACWLDFVAQAGERLLDRNSPERGLLIRNVGAARKFAGYWKIPLESQERIAALSATLVKIHKDSPECEAWRKHFARLNAELPIPDKVAWVFLPSLRPPQQSGADPPSLAEMDEILR